MNAFIGAAEGGERGEFSFLKYLELVFSRLGPWGGV